jgi:hypothetical protein
VSNINWLVADQLGTPRMIFDKTGWLENVKRHDYLPFGEELAVGQGLRTTGLGYSGDTVRQKFTLKNGTLKPASITSWRGTLRCCESAGRKACRVLSRSVGKREVV